MKKMLWTVFTVCLALGSKAQLSLHRAQLLPNGTVFFELANNSSSSLDLDCYTLVSTYALPQEKGFYVLTLPHQRLAPHASLRIGGTEPSVTWNHQRLLREGLLQKQVLNSSGTGLIRPTSLAGPANLPGSVVSEAPYEPMSLLYNGNTLIDASYTVDENHNLSQYLKALPNLAFTNACGNLVTVKFGTLQSMYAAVFSHPNQSNDYGYFKEFQVQKNNASVQIAWQTTREQNNRGFEIERKSGQEPWTTVAYVATLAPAGNSSETIQYLYGDRTLLKDNVQYRLRQVDVKGNTRYSAVQSLSMTGEGGQAVLYPNPSTDGRVNISFQDVNAPRDIQVLDINGQLIQQWLSVNSSTQQLNNLVRGNYIVRIIDRVNGAVSTKKLIVQ